ncbi:E3 ubiquitin-protein ligase UBR4-like [Gigantopelta aegis]|uniref:E3 ubiquitin-protein ligase UBR4-like n=1 Tax=Gigantopelta aegis TaxID=1735272 RepID=UPI001B8883C9|nr:E3 ubiquitin-protein ligase UBR4-like [Gigantopelta aegis]
MASGPGPGLSTAVKSLLSASYSSFNKNDLPNLTKGILKSENHIFEHDEEYEPFYSSFVALATHFLSASSSNLSKSDLSQTTSACQVLLRFLLQRLQTHSESCTISQKYLMILIKGLCKGNGCLPKADVVTFASMLKSAERPSNIIEDGEETKSKETKLPRLDTGSNLFDQLTSVFDEVSSTSTSKSDGPVEVVGSDGVTTVMHVNDAVEEMTAIFARKNTQILLQLDGASILLDACSHLVFLGKYMQRVKDAIAGKTFLMPGTLSEALTTRNSFQSLLSDISIVWRSFSLPALEPLTPKRLDKIVNITLSCLYASVTVAMANTIVNMVKPMSASQPSGSKDEEIDSYGRNIVQKTLEIFNSVSTTIRNSTRGGGNVAQNLNLLAVWILLKGLQGIMGLTPAMILERKDYAKGRDGGQKAKDSGSQQRSSTAKSAFQGFGVLAVALGTRAVQLLTALMDDLQIEGCHGDLETSISEMHPGMDVTISKSLVAWLRVKKLMARVSLTDLLFNLVTVSFKKAVLLKRLKQGSETSETSSSSTSDSNTFYEDDFSTSDNSSEEEDDDSEPILGHWFEETLSPVDSLDATVATPHTPRGEGTASESKRNRHHSNGDTPHFIPDKREPDGFTSLASSVLNFLNKYFVCSTDDEIQRLMKKYLNEDHVNNLSTLIKELDKECARPASGKNSTKKCFEDVSVALARLNHSLIASECLSENLQDNLLVQLGVSPNSVDPWPLTVHTHTLAVLAEVILLKQQKERETKTMKSQSDSSVSGIWVRFIATLRAEISSCNKGELTEDINVEHMQLLLFLFHSLQLMPKKTILLQLAQSIMSLSQIPQSKLETTVPLILSRMLLVFDYLLHYFYDPPAALIEQVQWNLFTIHTFSQSTDRDAVPQTRASQYFHCREVEDNFRKNLTAQETNEVGIFTPRFYSLGPGDLSNQDSPKIDGLACNILLSNRDSLDYNELYDLCISLLMAGSRCDKTKGKLTLLDASAMHYHFLLLWRLLACLPPSFQYIKSLEQGTMKMTNGHLLHTLRWAPRLGHKVFSGWIKDCLVKQGLTTALAETMLTSAAKATNNISFDVTLATNFINEQISALPKERDILPLSELPGLSSILIMDAVIAKVEVGLDDAFNKASADSDPHNTMDIAEELIPKMYQLIEAYTLYVRSCVLGETAETDNQSMSRHRLRAYATVMSIASNRSSKVSALGNKIMKYLPSPLRNAVEKWNTNAGNEFPGTGAWKNSNEILPCENYMDAIHSAHLVTLSGQATFSINTSLRHALQSLVKITNDLVTWCPDTTHSREFVRVMFPLMYDVTTEYLVDIVSESLEKFLGHADSEDFSLRMYEYVIAACHKLLVEYSDSESGLDEKILLDCLKYMEYFLEKSAGRKAFEKFYSEQEDLYKVLLCLERENLSSVFAANMLKFFNNLFQLAEENPDDKSYSKLCASLSLLALVKKHHLQKLLSKIISCTEEECEEDRSIKENRMWLRSLTVFIVKEKSLVGEEVSEAILSSLIPMGGPLLSDPEGDISGFQELMVIMRMLAGAGQGQGHVSLFKAATEWIEICKTFMAKPEIMEKALTNTGKGKDLLETLCSLLSYVGKILGALKKSSDRTGTASPPLDTDIGQLPDIDPEWTEDIAQEEEDSAEEDSDEESLNNKLCTFTITQKEFMNQHWYHCHTCKMVDGVGVCTICAKVCHKDHDLTYAKFGSFFCDCGAKEDGSCKSLVKRTAQSGLDCSGSGSAQSPFSMDTTHPSLLRRRLSSPCLEEKTMEVIKNTEQSNKSRETLCEQIERFKDVLLSHLESSSTVQSVLEMMEQIIPPLTANYQNLSPMGSTARAQKALEDLHIRGKKIETTSDQLMTVTLGSQEGAFENVRMNYNGEQGQTIRQLITAHMIHRVAMCVLSSHHGKRQHLAISHEKGKITILQLSALLKQADSSKKKLTLTRLSSAPIPFTVLSIVGNPCNEDFLAVCGLKDCHVLTFTSSGSVADHLVLHPSLATGNFIIKAIWLPGSQTELAIVTADFVKIYDLGSDAISPQFYFLLPSGKIRDATFCFTEHGHYMVLMSSSGYIYTQVMEDSSSANLGPFYITDVLEMKHVELKETNGQVAGGGVSVFYSHALQLLFFSYSQGKSFVAAVSNDMSNVTNIFTITFKSSNGSGKGGNNNQPLVQWSEISGHTGLIYCMAQTSNNPVVLMVSPDTIMMQEIKVVPAKAKIQDVVAIRHIASNTDQLRTTMILLCEDGSLRIYMANVENTNFWLSPYLQPQSPIAVLKPAKKKKTSRSGRPVGLVNFPTDFFEHCQQTNDIEFGGNDVLQVYNIQQVKQRLNTNGMYIASTKPAGFTLEINNTNNSTVMVGVRVLVGSQSAERTPSYLEVFGRTIQVNLSRGRWFDLPFTREESLTTDKKFNLFIGASIDPNGVTMLDSVKIYVKTKEAFGWPEETDEFPEASAPKAAVPVPALTSSTDSDTLPSAPLPMTSADKLLSSALEVLDGAFGAISSDEKDPKREKALDLATSLLNLPTPPTVQQHTKSLLASLFDSKLSYHNHKDQAQLVHVMQSLSKEGKEMDVEAFQRLVVTARSVAISRPMNLVKFAETGGKKEDVLEVVDVEDEKEHEKPSEPSLDSLSSIGTRDHCHFTSRLLEAFWNLHESKPPNPMLAPVCQPGLGHVDATVGAIVEIIHAFTMCNPEAVPMATDHYVKLLLSSDPLVSFASRQALIRVLRPRQRRRRVFIPSPPRCSSPGGGGEDDDDDDDDGKRHKAPDTPPRAAPVSNNVVEHQNLEHEGDEIYEVVESNEAMIIESGESSSHGNHLPSLDALWGVDRNFPPIVDIPPDADDETMVELAIALSLQDQSGTSGSLNLQSLGLARQGQSTSSIEEGPLSDTTASAPGSDDEVGSNAATEGSTLRTSPAEQGGSERGSESGGSAVDSISVSGRSSAYGYSVQEGGTAGARSETSSVGGPSGSMHHEVDHEVLQSDADYEALCRLHHLRLQLLERLLQFLPEIRNIGGVRAIPFMQVLLMLTSDLDSEEDKDRAALDSLLTVLLKELDLSGKDLQNIEVRTKHFEVKLILLRFLSVLLSRTRTGTKSSSEPSSFVSSSTATALLTKDCIHYCLQVLRSLLPYWKNFSADEQEKGTTPGQLLIPHPISPPPDMSPFFLRQYVKSHANDVFEDYPQLFTEMVLRLPYQLKKIADSMQCVPNAVFEQMWHSILSEYMMTQQTPFVKRQVRKPFRYKYLEQLRDMHAIESHLNNRGGDLSEGNLLFDLSGVLLVATRRSAAWMTHCLPLIEHLKVCSEIATSRPHNWQTYCEQAQETLPFLVKASISLDEGMAPTLLQLLQAALCGVKQSGQQNLAASSSSSSSASPVKQKKEKNKTKSESKQVKQESEDVEKFDETLCVTLVKLLNKVLDRELLVKFIRTFLLESNSSGNRWLAHSLVLQIYRNSSPDEKEVVLNIMWDLWGELPVFGRKATQFVDLLGYFVLKTPDIPDKKIREYLEKAVCVLREENQVLSNHPNATIYNMLQGLVDFDGYYLESDPCLVCNNPEVPNSNLKLSAVKVDSKFTTSTHIVKLVGSHSISKISLRISDLKRTKMVKALNIYYNNRTVQAVVELKNRPGLWHKAKKVTLTAGQTDVKVEFPIPIVACNLMIEYTDFFDNLQATAETLQCPRCSASVPANPGVCGNCGENVYQCHKCRAINYDEKDPFLCNACGFCKYAKFDFTLVAKPCCAVDPIENEEDRKKAISTINSMLEKADKIYKQLQTHRPLLENLLIQVIEHSTERLGDDMPTSGSGGVPACSVNKAIQLLAQKYCMECNSSFDELSKIIQKVLACRRELVEYDRQQREAVALKGKDIFAGRKLSKVVEVPTCSTPVSQKHKDSCRSSNCYGCASAAVEHCITLLRALVTNTNMRQILCTQGMIQQLIDYNLRHGTLTVRNEVRSLLCLLTKDNRRGTEEMNNLIMTRITAAIKGHQSNPDLGSSVRHEILLLASSLNQDDSCWEQRVRCVMRLFLMGMNMKSPVIMESITLPCLRILQSLVNYEAPATKSTYRSSPEGDILDSYLPAKFHMNVKKWLAGDPRYSYQNWQKRLPKRGPVEPIDKKKEARKEVRARYLMEKYGTRWQQKMWKTPAIQLKLNQTTWLQQAMFSPSSRSARQTACSIIEAIAKVPSRRKEVMDMTTRCLDLVGSSGECASNFLRLYKNLLAPDQWKYYLAIKGVPLHLGDLITKEVEYIQYLEEITLNSDLAQGFALKSLTELLSLFVDQENLKQHYKNKLVGYILNGYLSLRKLVVQRTKLIDETQEKMLELLEELTTGTESETKEFMSVCVQTVKKYPLDDYRSPVFIFERLCSIIYPEENDVNEFFTILEKDPQQEDFLQGRMLGNPYSCNEPGMGPLMRDIKNKICQDCELVALLEDDTGMELLVNKKIISLDLPVKEVYKKVWLPEHGEGEPMPITYRMRGLLGDATEDMVNSFDSKSEEDIDKEEVFKMGLVLKDCGGLHIMLERLSSIKDLVLGKQLMVVLLKLFGFAVNVKVNRQELIKPEMDTINIMLGALNLALWTEQEGGTSAAKGQTITEQILQIMEVILLEASQQPPQQYTEFSKRCGDKDQLMMLLERINSPVVRNNTSILQALMRLLPFLAFGEDDKMIALLNHFKPYLNFDQFDLESNQDEQVHLNCFCVVASAIESNANGIRLKNVILEHGIVQKSVDYILTHSPPIKTLLATDSEVWKEFIGKPSLTFVLRLLTGLCTKHTATQDLIANNCISILHKLEQVSSDKNVGTLSENLLDALKGNESAAQKIEEIRDQTKAEKKRLAMAVRKKQLGALGMTTNEKGQVTVKSSVLKQMEELKEETGLTCCICREGYRYQPQKVLAVYTFTRRTNLDDFENKSRKTVGYTTVSHFNVIHVDCHAAAVRHARGREEWESAALQNANTKCNGLLPLWGPQVQESVFATCLARHNNYLQECTGVRDPSHLYTVHDIKMLLMRFANEKSFSDESGGGGRQSNMYVLPYMIHMALYVINTTRSATRDEKSVKNFLDMAKEKWVENCFESDGPLYFTVLSMLVHPPDKWQEHRITFLRRLLIVAHCRHVCQVGAKTVPIDKKTPLEYTVYKQTLLFFGMVNALYEEMFTKVTFSSGVSWSSALAEYIRHNDRPVLDSCEKILGLYQTEMLPCESFGEFLDMIGLLSEISDPTEFITKLLAALP